jgi:hypothetical protein
MARGKYASKAAVKKVADERDAQAASYQHHIRRLTAENAELKQKLADQQADHAKTVRVLKAERDEGLSPQVKVLQQENERMKERVNKAEREFQYIKKIWNATARDMIRYLESLGLSPLDAREMFLNFGSDVPDKSGETGPMTIVEEPSLRKLNKKMPGAAKAIQRARGERS